MSNSVITVIGKDRVGIVYDVSRILAENQINILNISQQLMDDFFTMIILVDTSKCPKSRQLACRLRPYQTKIAPRFSSHREPQDYPNSNPAVFSGTNGDKIDWSAHQTPMNCHPTDCANYLAHCHPARRARHNNHAWDCPAMTVLPETTDADRRCGRERGRSQL